MECFGIKIRKEKCREIRIGFPAFFFCIYLLVHLIHFIKLPHQFVIISGISIGHLVDEIGVGKHHDNDESIKCNSKYKTDNSKDDTDFPVVEKVISPPRERSPKIMASAPQGSAAYRQQKVTMETMPRAMDAVASPVERLSM